MEATGQETLGSRSYSHLNPINIHLITLTLLFITQGMGLRGQLGGQLAGALSDEKQVSVGAPELLFSMKMNMSCGSCEGEGGGFPP